MTALVVQDRLGGSLKRALVDGISHYWNELSDREIDLTREQFTEFVPVSTTERSREYVLSNEHTARRYFILRQRVADLLAGGVNRNEGE